VFAVSDRPEIHSNGETFVQINFTRFNLLPCLGFHIKFERDVSMIEPIWIHDDLSNITKNQPSDDFKTCLLLPFDQNTFNKIEKLRKEIDDVFDDQLLLFLNKIKRMALHDLTLDRKKIHSKDILCNNWTLISSQYLNHNGIQTMSIQNYWFTKSLSFNPHMKRTANDEDISTETSIIIAIKFIQDTNCNEYYNSLSSDIDENQSEFSTTCTNLTIDSNSGLLPIYAYLPTKINIVPFVIQADFSLSSNREGILENDDWNLHILSYIPNLFKSIFQELANCIIYNNPPSFHSLINEPNYTVTITPKDLLSLLPKCQIKMKDSDP